MTFCGDNIQQKNWTANMYVAEELWSLCWTDVFITVPLSHNENSIQKSAEK